MNLDEEKTMKEEIIKLISDTLGVPVDENTEMGSITQWDSIHNLIVIQTVAEHYGVEIPDDDIFDLVSVKTITAEMEKLKA